MEVPFANFLGPSQKAEEVRALGGVGVAVSCDCGDAAAMEALVARVRADHGPSRGVRSFRSEMGEISREILISSHGALCEIAGRLDVLVCSARALASYTKRAWATFARALRGNGESSLASPAETFAPQAFGTPPKLNDASFRDDFWKQGMAMWDTCHGVGLRTRTPRLERRARAHSFSREGKPPVHPPWKR